MKPRQFVRLPSAFGYEETTVPQFHATVKKCFMLRSSAHRRCRPNADGILGRIADRREDKRWDETPSNVRGYRPAIFMCPDVELFSGQSSIDHIHRAIRAFSGKAMTQ